MKLRSDFREALTNMHRLYRESGEERPEPIPFLSIPKVAFVVFFIQYLMAALDIWIFSQSRTVSLRRCDLMVLGMVKMKHRRSTSSPIMQEKDVSKRVFKEFTIAFRKI